MTKDGEQAAKAMDEWHTQHGTRLWSQENNCWLYPDQIIRYGKTDTEQNSESKSTSFRIGKRLKQEKAIPGTAKSAKTRATRAAKN